MSKLDIEPLHEDFGARIAGIDLAGDLDDGVIERIHQAIDDFSLLCFPHQTLDDDGQLAFTRRLGKPEPEHVTFGKTGEVVYFGTVGNVVDADHKKGNDDPNTRYQAGNQMWHTDSSFRLIPSYVSITRACEVPGEGGATEFASMRVAYARMPGEAQAILDPLHVIHDYVFSRSQVAPVDANHAASLPPVEHKLVRTNPGNGRRNYYVGSHARSIVGWSGIDSRRLLDELLLHATEAQYIYSHQWQPGDLVIWDNRCLLHRGTGYDADRWRRLMRQTRVMGAGPTLHE